MISKKVVAIAGLAALLASRRRRSRPLAVPERVPQALRRRRSGLPRGVQEYPPTLVDRRHAPVAVGPVAAAETSTDIVAEYYEENPPAHGTPQPRDA